MKTPLRVVILRSNALDPDPRVEKIAASLGGAGYAVTALGWDMQGRSTDGNTPPNQQGGQVRWLRLPLRAVFGRGLYNLGHELRWQVTLFNWLRRQRQAFDWLHACDFDTLLPALLCRWLWRKAVIYDIFDFYADMLRRTPLPIKALVRAAELQAIGQADAVILADDCRTTQIAGSRPKRLAVIYNALDDRRVGSPAGRPAHSRLHLAYVGNLQVERGLMHLLAVLRRCPQWTLALAGFGSDEALLRQEAASLPNVTWYGRVPYEQALQLEAAADVLLATYDPAIPNHRFSSPNKVFEAMLLGKPILAARGTNVDSIVERANCGLVVAYGDEAALEVALLRLQDDPSLRQQLGANARRAFESNYNWPNMQTRLVALYRELENTLRPSP